MSAMPAAVATVAQSAGSLGINSDSTMPPTSSSSTSAPIMYAGWRLTLPPIIPAIRFAWISTPG